MAVIPARYAVGYSVQGGAIVKRRILFAIGMPMPGRAWYVDGAWEDLEHHAGIVGERRSRTSVPLGSVQGLVIVALASPVAEQNQCGRAAGLPQSQTWLILLVLAIWGFESFGTLTNKLLRSLEYSIEGTDRSFTQIERLLERLGLRASLQNRCRLGFDGWR